jgi:hypothetical protein
MLWLLKRRWELYGNTDAIYKFVTRGAHCWKYDDSSRRRVGYFGLILCNMHCLKGAAPSPNVQLSPFKICYHHGQSICGMVPSAYCGRWAGDKQPIFVWFKIELQQMWLSGGPEGVRNQRNTCTKATVPPTDPIQGDCKGEDGTINVWWQGSTVAAAVKQHFIRRAAQFDASLEISERISVTTNQMMFSTCLQGNLVHFFSSHSSNYGYPNLDNVKAGRSLHLSRDPRPPPCLSQNWRKWFDRRTGIRSSRTGVCQRSGHHILLTPKQ